MPLSRAYVLYLLSVVTFGCNGIIASYIDQTSTTIVFFRLLLGSLFLLGVMLVRRQGRALFRYPRDLAFVLVSGLAMGISWLFLYEAFDRVGVGVASLLYACGPVIVMAISPLVFQEKLTRLKVGAFAAVFIGVCMINGTEISFHGEWLGVLCGLGSAVTYAVMVVTNKQAQDLSGLDNTQVQLSAGLVTVATFMAFTGGFDFVISRSDWPFLLVLGFFSTGLACLFFFSALTHLPAQSVAILGYLEPLTALFLSAWLLGEKLVSLQIPGAIFILAGAFVAEVLGNRQQAGEG
ncbi:DMT family transporter [Peptococcus simiae]|uniref:DMT family transporter n=1 Tax=Peptococcus simiae TaxID=1643805 RepID=A0ABW9GWI5_9FIRM